MPPNKANAVDAEGSVNARPVFRSEDPVICLDFHVCHLRSVVLSNANHKLNRQADYICGTDDRIIDLSGVSERHRSPSL